MKSPELGDVFWEDLGPLSASNVDLYQARMRKEPVVNVQKELKRITAPAKISHRKRVGNTYGWREWKGWGPNQDGEYIVWNYLEDYAEIIVREDGEWHHTDGQPIESTNHYTDWMRIKTPKGR